MDFQCFIKPTQTILRIEELLQNELTIPNYQRAYKWTKKSVEIFLNDIREYSVRKKTEYRLGTLIIHEEGHINETESSLWNVVDGQQRLTTLYLTLHSLGSTNFKLRFSKIHTETKNNIQINYDFIHDWIKRLGNKEAREFKDALLTKCQFAMIKVYSLSSAFQLFDSQNTRGKELLPEDLLKSFHLQKMSGCKEEEKQRYVEQWERLIDETQNDFTIKQLLSEHLFRIRKWIKGEESYVFTKNDIHEFKGIDIPYDKYNDIQDNESAKGIYGFSNAELMFFKLIECSKNNGINSSGKIYDQYPFLVNQRIINGKYFFEYVFFYYKRYKKLFVDDFNEMGDFFRNYCLYPYSYRQGDYYVRNLYQNILIQFESHFNIIILHEYYKDLYRYAYKARLSKRLGLRSVLNQIPIFSQIAYSLDPHEFNEYKYCEYICDEEIAKGLENVKSFITNRDNEK